MQRTYVNRGAIAVATFIVLCLWLQPPVSAEMRKPSVKPAGQSGALGSFLGLRQAIEIALEKHPVIQAAGANLKAAEARTEQTRSLYYPQVYANFDTISGVGGINPRFVAPAGAMLRQNLSQYTGGVIANQRLYDFGFTKHLVESSDLAARAQEQDVNSQRALVILNVQRAYLNSLKRRRLVQIAEETVRQRGVIRSQVDTLYRQQLKSKLDLDLVQVELTNAESALVKTKNDLKASFADLNRAIGITGPEDYVLEDVPIEVRPQRPLEALITDSLSHPELQRAKEFGPLPSAQTLSSSSGRKSLRARQRPVSKPQNGYTSLPSQQWPAPATTRSSIPVGIKELVAGGLRVAWSRCRSSPAT